MREGSPVPGVSVDVTPQHFVSLVPAARNLPGFLGVHAHCGHIYWNAEKSFHTHRKHLFSIIIFTAASICCELPALTAGVKQFNQCSNIWCCTTDLLNICCVLAITHPAHVEYVNDQMFSALNVSFVNNADQWQCHEASCLVAVQLQNISQISVGN